MLDFENVSVILVTVFLIWMLIRNIIEIQIHLEKEWDLAVFLLFFAIYILVFPLIKALGAIFWIYRNIVAVLLRIKLGDEFYGLVKNFDVTNSIFKKEFSYVHILMILECDQNTGDHLYEFLKSSMHKYQKQHEKDLGKLYCTLSTWLGFLYYKKIQVSADEYVLKLPVSNRVKELDSVELMKLLSESYYSTLPLNDTMIWDVHVGTQPLRCEIPNKKQYPVLFRIHHTIGDGISFVKLFLSIFADDNVQCFKIGSHVAKYIKEKSSWWKSIVSAIDMFVLIPTLLFTSLVLKKNDKNYPRKTLIKKEILAYGTDEDGKYFRKVKSIQKKWFQTSFSEIIFTAVSASMDDCYKKYTSSSPTHLIAMMPVVSNYQQLLETSTKNVKSNKLTLSNRFVPLQPKMPICIDNHKDYNIDYPLRSRLKMIKEIFRSLKNPADFLFKTTILRVLEVFPVPMLRLLYSHYCCTVGLSIVPGPPEVISNEGKIKISSCIFWLAHLIDMGINFSVLTYNDQLHIGLNCNGSLGLSEKAVSEIVTNTYKYLDLLEEEIDDYNY